MLSNKYTFWRFRRRVEKTDESSVHYEKVGGGNPAASHNPETGKVAENLEKSHGHEFTTWGNQVVTAMTSKMGNVDVWKTEVMCAAID